MSAEDNAAARRYAEALASATLAGQDPSVADDVRPDLPAAELSKAMATVADELAATPDDTTAAEELLRAGESARAAARATEAGRRARVVEVLDKLGISAEDLRVLLR